jgi:hypothetical protein
VHVLGKGCVSGLLDRAHTSAVMPPEKANDIVNSPEFMSFFDRSTKLIERALNEKYDVAIDYAATDHEEECACVCACACACACVCVCVCDCLLVARQQR